MSVIPAECSAGLLLTSLLHSIEHAAYRPGKFDHDWAFVSDDEEEDYEHYKFPQTYDLVTLTRWVARQMYMYNKYRIFTCRKTQISGEAVLPQDLHGDTDSIRDRLSRFFASSQQLDFVEEDGWFTLTYYRDRKAVDAVDDHRPEEKEARVSTSVDDTANSATNGGAQRCREWIRKLEDAHGIEVLWAIESGSRAWKFESADSDYDIRGFFRYKDKSKYVSIFPRDKSCVQEFTEDRLMDVELWDIDKAIIRLSEGNPIIVEWLLSQQIYQSKTGVLQIMLGLLDQMDPTSALLHHYRSMGRSHIHKYHEGREHVNIKKYMYCIRPVVMILWLLNRSKLTLQGMTTAPLLMIDVVQAMQVLHELSQDVVPSSVHVAFQRLATFKRNLSEAGGECARVPEIDQWMVNSLRMCDRALDESTSVVMSTRSVIIESDLSDIAQVVQALGRKVSNQLQTTVKATSSVKTRPLMTHLVNNAVALVMRAGLRIPVVISRLTHLELESTIRRCCEWMGDVNEANVWALMDIAKPTNGTVWNQSVPLVRAWAQCAMDRLQDVLRATAACEQTRQCVARAVVPDVNKDQLRRRFDLGFQQLLAL